MNGDNTWPQRLKHKFSLTMDPIFSSLKLSQRRFFINTINFKNCTESNSLLKFAPVTHKKRAK